MPSLAEHMGKYDGKRMIGIETADMLDDASIQDGAKDTGRPPNGS